MRLTILVIASDNLHIYSGHQSLWRSYATSHPDVTVYFIRQSKETQTPHIDGDTIWSHGEEATERIFEKTVAAFKLLDPTSYDYLIRTNLSSVWNFTKTLEFCATLPKENVFCGVLGNPGISGAGMILSPDVVLTLAEHSDIPDRCMWDDIDFGKVAARQGIPSTPATRYDPKSRSDVDRCWTVGYHFYLKDMRTGTRNVGNELDVMRYLISKIYPPQIDAVVAVYKEPVDWIRELPVRHAYIYLKDPTRLDDVKARVPGATVISLPNLGREANSYLHHIVIAYSTLAPYTVFLQGNPFDHCSQATILHALESPSQRFVPFGRRIVSDANGYPDHPNLPVSRMFETYLGRTRKTFEFHAGAQFLVARDVIREHSPEIYTRLVHGSVAEPLFPWCMERYWSYLFGHL